ncbi:hypothetical protein AUK40_00960 [Candidatus Wirthbacteria bacterium CG2_30_54_11]|uniref:Ni/Fe hydrogenase subunit alpha n=1 Tax=Candidatus Wirthbacteria bacterium CG2_30_54_11 TaxID=1817892 RepID=A0A1J5J643_9BACT|nr:MAG: hypothetical protein AUK40_00960 [Candidatus Wirthbacteria bacterium CG2_30_54_11]
MTDIAINVHHLTRVEGHGNIVVNVKDGRVEKCEWRVPEAPRFFEAMIRGRHYSEVSRITSRICGICAVGHTLSSVRATENALGMTMTEQSVLLRNLLKHGENADSHLLHIYFLVAPDLVGAKSVFPLASTHPDVVKRALRMKKISSDWAGLVGGRSTHPTRVVAGGFASIPTVKQLEALKQELVGTLLPDAMATYELLKSLASNIPTFSRPTEYVALVKDGEYPVYDGDIGCLLPDGQRESYDVDDYLEVAQEWVSPLSTAKHAKHKLDSYMAGALARVNLNYQYLHPEAKRVAEGLGFKAPVYLPYYNTVAQFIEVVHATYTAVELIDRLINTGLRDEPPVKPTRYGKGAGATEVPRGILFHEYEYDHDGMCLGGNCIIPTNQNHANIQLDFDKLVPELLTAGKTEKEMELALEMLVRAYDPCISCSTHYLDVSFKG